MTKRDIITKIVVNFMIRKGYADVRSMHKNTVDAGKKNEQLLFKILKANESCEFGKKHHFSEIKSVEDFRKNVPVTTFDDYEDYIVRMIDNDESNLITSQPIVGYAQSSGSVGKRKFVPITQPEVNIYTKYTITKMLALADKYSKEKNGRGLKVARGMLTCPSFDDKLPNGVLCSNIADVTAKQFGAFYPYALNIPFKKMFNEMEAESKYVNCRFALEDKNTMFMYCVFFREITTIISFLEETWETIVDDIEHGTVSDLAMATPEALEKMKPFIKPNPERAAELRREFSKGFDETLFKRIWPNMSVICGIGTSTFAPFSEKARNYTKGIPFDFANYGASEGLFAATDELDASRHLMLVDSCYYEFVPVDDDSKFLALDELEIGKEYSIIITNQAGLYRYKCGDVVKVIDYLNECPYILFSYREGQLLNITGEKTTEDHMSAVVNEIGQAAGYSIMNWAAYNVIEKHPYHYKLLIENDKGIDMRQFTDLAHQKLCEINPRYAYFTAINGLGKIVVENQIPGTHKEWIDGQIAKGTSRSQVKPVRVIDNPQKEEHFLSRIVQDK